MATKMNHERFRFHDIYLDEFTTDVMRVDNVFNEGVIFDKTPLSPNAVALIKTIDVIFSRSTHRLGGIYWRLQ